MFSDYSYEMTRNTAKLSIICMNVNYVVVQKKKVTVNLYRVDTTHIMLDITKQTSK